VVVVSVSAVVAVSVVVAVSAGAYRTVGRGTGPSVSQDTTIEVAGSAPNVR